MSRLAIVISLFSSLFFPVIIIMTGLLNGVAPHYCMENGFISFFLFGFLGFVFGFLIDIYMLGRGGLVSSFAENTVMFREVLNIIRRLPLK